MPDPITLEIGAPPPPASANGTGSASSSTDTPPAADVWTDDLAPAPEVPEPVVRGILAAIGGLVAMSPLAEPDVEDHWRFSEQELDDLTPPMTRIVNARPQLRAAAARGDEVVVAVQLAGYLGRNIITGGLARRARLEHEGDLDGYLDREADGATPPGGGPADGPGGREPGGGLRTPAGSGIHPANL